MRLKLQLRHISTICLRHIQKQRLNELKVTDNFKRDAKKKRKGIKIKAGYEETY